MSYPRNGPGISPDPFPSHSGSVWGPAAPPPRPPALVWTLSHAPVPPPSPALPWAYKIRIKCVLGVYEVKESEYSTSFPQFDAVCAKNAPRPSTLSILGTNSCRVPPPSPALPRAYKINIKYVLGAFEVRESDYDIRITWFLIGCAGIAPTFWVIVTLNVSSPPNELGSSWVC